MRYESLVSDLLGQADVRVNGDRPQDIQVFDERFFRRFLRDGRLGLGESYMDGWWDCQRIDEFTRRIYRSALDGFSEKRSLRDLWTLANARFAPAGSLSRAYDVAHKHYDVGNDLFTAMLDKRMIYSCPYWDDPNDTLDAAQEKKLDLSCRKLRLRPGMRVLDVGCGWGGFAKFAAEKYDVKVVGVSVSKEQVELARRICAGLDVELHVMDYREASTLGRFDRIVSIGMFEHVGVEYYSTFFKIMAACLADDGLFLLHTNILRDSNYASPWLTKYIFPNGFVPSMAQATRPMEGTFFIEHVENIGPYYYRTFLTWHENFSRDWESFKHRYDERFRRMWTYYLLSVSAGYEARYVHVCQMVLAKKGRAEAYRFA